MAKKQGMVSKLIYRAMEQKQAAEQAAVTASANTLKANRSTDLSRNNAPVVSTPDAGVSADVAQVGGSTIKRRRATGALSSQLGVNV